MACTYVTKSDITDETVMAITVSDYHFWTIYSCSNKDLPLTKTV